MAFCTYCGANNPDGAMYCVNCGAPQQTPIQQTGLYNGVNPVYRQPVQPIPTGGIIAWAIITLLLCMIPGIVALVKAIGINNSFSVEEQQQKLSSAKTWCLVGTILGGLAFIGGIISGIISVVMQAM